MSDLGSMRFIEENDKEMYVNELSDGGVAFVLWNGGIPEGTKNTLCITAIGKQELLKFLNTPQQRSCETCRNNHPEGGCLVCEEGRCHVDGAFPFWLPVTSVDGSDKTDA